MESTPDFDLSVLSDVGIKTAMVAKSCSINDLPDEILESILSMVSPYRDFKHVLLVCRRWNYIMSGMVSRYCQQFKKALETGSLMWSCHLPATDVTIMPRYAHCTCYYDRALYVFGGCTSSATTFNDLWKFDLVDECWFRPLASGSYPSPKAWASMVAYKESLVLFGGWSYPTPITFHQASRFFNQLHLYDPGANEWSQVTSQNCPEGTAGHGASVIGDSMIVFGGSHRYENSCNEVLVLNLKEMIWRKQPTTENKPRPRFSHSQVVIDDQHILVLGGCGGANMQLSDAWLLTLGPVGSIWQWQELSIMNPEFSAPQLWCHPACKVGDRMVILSKNTKMFSCRLSQPPAKPQQILSRCHDARKVANQVSSRSRESVGECVGQEADESSVDHNGQTVECQRSAAAVVSSSPQSLSAGASSCIDASCSPTSDALSLSASSTAAVSSTPAITSVANTVRSGMPCIRPNAMKNRLHQLETLKKYEEKFRMTAQASRQPRLKIQRMPSSVNPICVHTIDLGRVVTEGSIAWLPIQQPNGSLCPEETIFYSITEGRGELILFGGICGDLHTMERGLPLKAQAVSNTIFYLSFKEHTK